MFKLISIAFFCLAMLFASPAKAQDSAQAQFTLTVNSTTALSVALSWTASTSTGITAYQVYRAPGSGTVNLAYIGEVNGTTTTYTDTTAEEGDTYTYAVTACGAATCSVYSNEVAITVTTSEEMNQFFRWAAFNDHPRALVLALLQ